MSEQEDAAKVAGDAMERALLKATQTVERELARIMKTGEDDLDRLARKIAETLAAEANAQVELGSTADHRGAVTAFLSKQKPVFEGR